MVRNTLSCSLIITHNTCISTFFITKTKHLTPVKFSRLKWRSNMKNKVRLGGLLEVKNIKVDKLRMINHLVRLQIFSKSMGFCPICYDWFSRPNDVAEMWNWTLLDMIKDMLPDLYSLGINPIYMHISKSLSLRPHTPGRVLGLVSFQSTTMMTN